MAVEGSAEEQADEVSISPITEVDLQKELSLIHI